jgi:hypothetical protein
MTPEAAFNFIRHNGDKCLKVLDMNGYSLIEYEGTSPDNAIEQFSAHLDMLAQHKRLRVFGGVDARHCNNKDGHTYLIEFEGAAPAKGVAAPAPIQNGVNFETVIGLMKDNNAALAAMNNKNAELQLELVRKEISGLKEKKSEISEFAGAAKELFPLYMQWKSGSPTPPAVSNIRGPATLTFEELKKKPVEELTKLYNERFLIFQQKVDAPTAIQYQDLMINEPAITVKFLNLMQTKPDQMTKLIEAVTNKPELLDVAVSLLNNP